MTSDRLLRTFLDLVTIDSESRNERKVCDYIRSVLCPYATKFLEDNAAEATGGNCGNLFAWIKGNTESTPRIMLNTHMDVVPPGNGVRPVVEGDMVRSSGDTVLGADDKAGVAVVLEAVMRLKETGQPHGDILLLFTVAEELGLLGARSVDPALLEVDFGVTLDCTGGPGAIYTASPTHDRLVVDISGRAAHAGMEPEKGISAIRVASNAISRMKLGRIDFETTANVGIIRGGRAINIIPDAVRIEAEARSHNAEKLDAQIAHMREAFEIAAQEAGASVSITHHREYERYSFAPDSPIIKRLKAAAVSAGFEPELHVGGGGSDANVFNSHGITTVPIGAGYSGCHSTSETISIKAMDDITKFVLSILESA